MSISASAVAERPIAADPAPASSTSKTPPGRRMIATADPVDQPQP
jgi:hypothetical protein